MGFHVQASIYSTTMPKTTLKLKVDGDEAYEFEMMMEGEELDMVFMP